MDGADFLLWKEPPLVEQYARLLDELRPQHIIELGIMEGGSTALLLELAHPRRMVAIDRKPPTQPALRDYVSRRGLEEVVHIHDDVDQADRDRLAAIVEAAFGDQPLDLVVDDCSHMYEATRASFNALFPLLRPGGIYIIEDWPWAHEQPVADQWANEVPLTRLIVEFVIASACAQDLIAEIRIDPDSVRLMRGDANLAPSSFEISELLDERGRSLLASG